MQKRAVAAASLAALFWATVALAVEPRVPYVPTPQDVVDRMLEVAKVGAGDYLIDLGSGDGRIVITAAKKYGARGFGVDINPDRIRESNENARQAGVTDKVVFYQRSLFETDLSQATVITMYLLPRVNVELRPKLLQLAPGTRVVSHDFDMGDWKPDRHVTVDAREKYGSVGGKSEVYFWIVPAQAAGTWQWRATVGGKPQAYEMRLQQTYQTVAGSVWAGGRETKVLGGRLRGADIQFRFTADVNGSPVKHEFTGRVEGENVVGSVALSGPRIQAKLEWNARRVARAAAAAVTPAFGSALN